jgi:hypothetical protein
VQKWRITPIKRLISASDPFTDNAHLHHVWRGLAQYPNDTGLAQPMFIKWIADRPLLAAELASALTAQAFDLPVPDGCLVLADAADLPGLPRAAACEGANKILCYGSQFMGPDDTVGRPIAEAYVQEWIWQQVCNTDTGPQGGVWDELLANEDRHCDNVVSSGARWWLIDHEGALPSLASMMRRFSEALVRQSLIDHHSRHNELANEMMRRRDDHGMARLPGEWQRKMRRLEILIAVSKNWDTTTLPYVDNTLEFTRHYLHGMRLRIPALSLHLAQRLGIPTAASLWNSPPSNPPSA